jgi:transcriptional antiterminator NusG
MREFVLDDSKDDLDDGLDYFEDDTEPGEEKAPAKKAEQTDSDMFFIEEETIKKVSAGSIAAWSFSVSSKASPATLSFSVEPGRDDAPEWEISLSDSSSEVWNSAVSLDSVEIALPKTLELRAECPSGVRYGDSVRIRLEAKAGAYKDSLTFEAVAKQSILILKTQIDQEKSVADTLSAKAHLGEKDVYAILSPQGLRGYVFVEGMNTERLLEKTRDIKKARKFIEGEASIADIEPYLTPTSPVVGIVEGDIVELVNGPFKGEKARVQKIDQVKEEITVELIEAMVPIPVTVKGDSVRVIEKEK